MLDDSAKKALEAAAKLLSYHSFSYQELIDRLIEKEHSPAAAVAAADRLVELNIVNDNAYAAALAESMRRRGFGTRRLQQELRRHKLPDDVIACTVEAFEPDYDKLREYAEAHLTGGDRRQMKRVCDALTRRGFLWHEIEPVVRQAADRFGQEDTWQ